tara:strand:+ start:86067 stop:87125 length:1059 start_codon:yes stop_codon:yes gene_type:complete
MLGIVRLLRAQGQYRHFDIAARHVPRGFRIPGQGIVSNRVQPLDDLDIKKYSAEDVLIYHHGIASDAEQLIRHFPGNRFLVYHGLTPAGFYLPYNLTVAGRLERGRRELERLASAFERAYCFSRVTEADLREAGYLNIRKVDPPLQDVWSASTDQTFEPRAEVADSPVVLSVGRIVPNKNHEPLIRMLPYLRRLHPGARLIFAGELRPGLERYHRHLMDLVRTLDIQNHVAFTGLLDAKSMERTWKESTHLLCTSLHEGYCLPLVEAMVRNKPVLYLRYGGSAAAETMDGAGVGFYPADFRIMAELISEVHTNVDLREQILRTQRERLNQLQPAEMSLDILHQISRPGGVSD